MEALSSTERLLLEALLAGDHPLFENLRTQARTATVVERENRPGTRAAKLLLESSSPTVALRVGILHDVGVWAKGTDRFLGNPTAWIFDGRLSVLGVPVHLLECDVASTEWTVGYWTRRGRSQSRDVSAVILELQEAPA
jgi:hypothetical protein